MIESVSEKHRRSIGEMSEELRLININDLNDTQQKILVMLSKNSRLSASKMEDQIGISKRNVESNIKKLKEQGILARHGSPKNGYWEIVNQIKLQR